MQIHLSEESPAAAEYVALRQACAMAPRTLEAARVALPKSLFSVTLRDETGRLVGMGRIIGDLGCHVQLVDIAVSPDFQKQGLSRRIMDRLMEFVKKEVPDCAFVNLFADVDFLYEKYGFVRPKSVGMALQRDR